MGFCLSMAVSPQSTYFTIKSIFYYFLLPFETHVHFLLIVGLWCGHRPLDDGCGWQCCIWVRSAHTPYTPTANLALCFSFMVLVCWHL